MKLDLKYNCAVCKNNQLSITSGITTNICLESYNSSKLTRIVLSKVDAINVANNIHSHYKNEMQTKSLEHTSVCKIVVEADKGSFIDDIIRDCITKANNTGVTVECKFNGVLMIVPPKSTLLNIATKWELRSKAPITTQDTPARKPPIRTQQGHVYVTIEAVEGATFDQVFSSLTDHNILRNVQVLFNGVSLRYYEGIPKLDMLTGLIKSIDKSILTNPE